MSVPSHDPEQTAVHGPKSAGSPIARSPNLLDRAVDTSGVEAHSAQNMMETVVVSIALLP